MEFGEGVHRWWCQYHLLDERSLAAMRIGLSFVLFWDLTRGWLLADDWLAIALGTGQSGDKSAVCIGPARRCHNGADDRVADAVGDFHRLVWCVRIAVCLALHHRLPRRHRLPIAAMESGSAHRSTVVAGCTR